MATIGTWFKVFKAIIKWPFEKKKYINPRDITYHSRRYDKSLTVLKGFESDGSTASPNLGKGWLFHDRAFEHGHWDDGTPIEFKQANRIMADIMEDEGWPKLIRKAYWRGIKSRICRRTWNEYREKDKESMPV